MPADFENLSIRISASAKDAITKVNQLADALKSLNSQLAAIDASKMSGVASVAQDFGNAVKGMSGKRAAKDLQAVADGMTRVSQSASGVAQVANAQEQLAEAASHAAQATKEASKAAETQGKSGFQRFSDSVRSVRNNIGSTTARISELGKNLSKIFPHANKAASGMRKMSSASKKTAISSKGLAKELLRVSKMFKLMITRMILRKIISGIGDGFKNLAQYSSQVNASLSLLWNSFRQLGNSIAAAASPLLNAFAPALNYIIQLVIQAVNAINQLISALMGLGTWTKAKTLTDSYADSLKKAGGAAKELKKTVLGFDELNQLQDNKSSGGGGTSPANMFEEAGIDDKWKKLADKIKKYWEKLVNPIKRAWARAGEYVKAAWTRAFNNVKKLVMDIVDDFFEVWNQPETVHMLEDIFRIIGNIGTFVGNLAAAFDRAWNKADVGKRILEDIRDIAAIIVARIEDITLSWALWVDKLDFTPLMESTEKWLSSMKKPIDALMGVLSDLNDHFIQPVAKWLIEVGIPKLEDVFTSFNNNVDWDKLRERLDSIWGALSKFTTTVGSGLIQFVKDISDALADGINSDEFGALVDAISSFINDIEAQDVYNACKLIVDAFLLYKGLEFLTKIASAIEKITAALKVVLPVLQDFASYCQEGFVVGISLAWDEYMAGTIFDWNTWEGSIKKIIDWLGILWNNIVMFAGYPIVFFSEDDPTSAFQSFEKYNEAVKILEENNASLAGSYDEVIARAAELQKQERDLTLGFEGALAPYVTYVDSVDNVTKSTSRLREETARMGNVVTVDLRKYKEEMARTGQVSKEAATNASSAVKDLGVTTETETYNMKEAYSNLSRDIPVELKTLEKSNKDVTDSIKSSFDESEWTFSGVADGLRSTFEGAKNAIKGIWNSIADSLNGEHSLFNSKFSINLPHIYASGGFPEDGLFMANHNELVGKFSNGRTAVANNEQITDGIARAVYSAITAANSGGGSTPYINNTIEIDGVAIARAVTKGQERLNRRYSPTMA